MGFGLNGKKGFEFLTNWVAVFFVSILILSFLLAVVIVNPWVDYLIIVFAGVILGHFIFTGKSGNRFPYFLLSFAFIAGFLAGHRVGNGIVMLVVFIASIVVTNKILQMTE